MSERAPGGDPTAEMASLSWPVAAGIISGLLLVVLGGSYVLTRAARQGGAAVLAVQATATTAATVAATPTSAPSPRATTVRGTTTTVGATTVPGTTTTVGATTVPGTTATVGTTISVGTVGIATFVATASTVGTASTLGTPIAAGTQVIGAVVSSGAVSSVTSVLPLATAQPSPTPRGWWDAYSDVPENERAEVEQAYAHFWDVRSEALLELDPDRLTEIMAGVELTAEQQAIKDLQANGRAQRVEVEHHERITWATSDAATVLDEYVSHTMLVDAETKQPVEDRPSAPFRLAYLFRKVGAQWLVVESVQVKYVE